MPIDWLTLGAALLAGLMGGVHCAAMCGGIATGFSAMSGRSSWLAALEPNLGRVLGYTLAGTIVGGIGHGLLSVARVDWLAWGLRSAVGLVLLLVIIGTFIWAVRRGQFEDLDTPAIDILSDEAPPPGRPGQPARGASTSTSDGDAD